MVLMPGPEQEQITHAGNAALSLDVEHQNIARFAESVAFQPGVFGHGTRSMVVRTAVIVRSVIGIACSRPG